VVSTTRGAAGRLAAAPFPAACAAEPLPTGRQKPLVAIGPWQLVRRRPGLDLCHCCLLKLHSSPAARGRLGRWAGADLHLRALPDSGTTANTNASSPPHLSNSGEW